MADARRLVSLPVREFVARIASADEPVPAAGSAAALTGAASAALLALVSEIQARKQVADALVEQQRADNLQQRLLALVDTDAEAFRALLQAKRTQIGLDQALGSTTRTPLEIAAACAEVVALSTAVEAHTRGLLLGDVRSARTLASAALAAALDIAEQNVALVHADPSAQKHLQDEISRLRSG